MKILRAGLLASLAMLSIACTQLPAGNATETAQRDERVIEGRLDNGLRYRLVPTQEQPGRLDIRLRVDAGSVDERTNQVGVAHLLEHMLFYNRDARQRSVRQRLQAAGWVQGRNFNAMTSAEIAAMVAKSPLKATTKRFTSRWLSCVRSGPNSTWRAHWRAVVVAAVPSVLALAVQLVTVLAVIASFTFWGR